MTLGEKQELFARLLPRLINKAHELGFEIRVGDLFRDQRVHGEYGVKKGYGAAFSMHKLKLAVDLNLFFGGVWKTKSEDFQEVGEWWEKQHELCRWGGRFNESTPGAGDGFDANHFSITHDGRA